MTLALGADALREALGAAGVAGLAVGFAVKDTIENYVASVMLSVRQPFRPNDHVVIDGKEGRVIRLTSRATVLMTLDGNHLRIPNGAVFKAVILNYTRNAERRFDFKLGVDADDDAQAAATLGVDQRLDIVRLVEARELARRGARAVDIGVLVQPPHRAGEVYDRRHPRNGKRVLLAVAGMPVDVRADEQGAGEHGRKMGRPART